MKLFRKAQSERRRTCNEKKKNLTNAQERLRRFKTQTRFGPIFVCSCCKRKLFQHQVKKIDIEAFKQTVESKNVGLFALCINSCIDNNKSTEHNTRSLEALSTNELDLENFICKGCKGAMDRGKMPKMCYNNGLKVDPLPEDLRLTDLENNLVSKNIIFQKVHKKPKSRMAGTHDRMVNIPISDKDIIKTIKSLPRTPAESRIITVGKLKRKIEYKNTHLEQLIDIQKIFRFLHHLKNVLNNKNYQFYDD